MSKASLFLEPKAAKDWINHCEFHPLGNKEVLTRVIDETKAGKNGKSAQPVVLLDLDSTLYEVGPRTYQILKEWLASPASCEFSKVRDAVAGLQLKQVGYSLKDTFENLGLSQQDNETLAALKQAKKFWTDRFFTHSYLEYDHVYDGAVDFVKELYDHGAELIYLTGRDEPGMGDGTRSRLLSDGFPWQQDRTHLLLKKRFELDDLEHKAKAADYVHGVGSLVASFENEPPNIIGLSEVFPQAMHIFVDTIYSDRPAMPKKGLYRITGYK